MTQCAKCGRTVVQGLTEFIDSWHFFYGPGDKDSKWPRQEVRVGRVVGLEPVPPEGASVYGGKCSQCGKTYCIICMSEVLLDRLAKAAAGLGSGKSGIGTLLDEKGELWCPQCNTNIRTVKAW